MWFVCSVDRNEDSYDFSAVPPNYLLLEEASPVCRARALYTCELSLSIFKLQLNLFIDTASADDPTEISFAKNELLDILDKEKDWWAVRKKDGTLGSA